MKYTVTIRVFKAALLDRPGEARWGRGVATGAAEEAVRLRGFGRGRLRDGLRRGSVVTVQRGTRQKGEA